MVGNIMSKILIDINFTSTLPGTLQINNKMKLEK